MIMNVIDGRKDRGYAPTPSRGLHKALYECVDTLAGPSDPEDIRKLLPAAITETSQVPSIKKIKSNLQSMVWSGYLIRREDKFQVAPLAYYEARQKVIAEMKETRQPGVKRNNPGVIERDMLHAFDEHGSANFWKGFAIGISAGVAIGCAAALIIANMVGA